MVSRLLISACAGMSVAILTDQLINLLTRRRQVLQSRLKAAVSTAQEAPSLFEVAGGIPIVKKRRFTLPVIPNLRQLVGKQYLENVRLNLMKAGLPIKPEELMTITAISSMLGLGMAAFMFTFYPDFAMVLLKEPLGVAMLIAAGVMMVIGVFAIRKVVNIDV
ncbi:MAG TPA: hypothetical protein GXX23_04410 [Firmicutes bacterium]|nr:hypothetical protein [Candidatus Fermentithermobacillaceae bacterium]